MPRLLNVTQAVAARAPEAAACGCATLAAEHPGEVSEIGCGWNVKVDTSGHSKCSPLVGSSFFPFGPLNLYRGSF